MERQRGDHTSHSAKLPEHLRPIPGDFNSGRLNGEELKQTLEKRRYKHSSHQKGLKRLFDPAPFSPKKP